MRALTGITAAVFPRKPLAAGGTASGPGRAFLLTVLPMMGRTIVYAAMTMMFSAQARWNPPRRLLPMPWKLLRTPSGRVVFAHYDDTQHGPLVSSDCITASKLTGRRVLRQSIGSVVSRRGCSKEGGQG